MEGWVDLGDRLHAEMFYPPIDSDQRKVLTQQRTAEVEHATCWSRVRRPNHYTTKRTRDNVTAALLRVRKSLPKWTFYCWWIRSFYTSGALLTAHCINSK